MLSLTQLNLAGTFMNSACKTLRNYKKSTRRKQFFTLNNLKDHCGYSLNKQVNSLPQVVFLIPG